MTRFELSHRNKQSRYLALEFPQIEKELGKNKGGAGNYNSFRHSFQKQVISPDKIAYDIKKSPHIHRIPELDSKITRDKAGSIRIDMRSRDVSHLFDNPMNTKYGNFSDRKLHYFSPEQNSQRSYRMLEKDLASIYKTKEVLLDPKIIEQSSIKLAKRIFSLENYRITKN